MSITSAGIYVRISRDSELDGLGVKRQEKDCRKLLKTKGWELFRVYIDNDTSASSKKPRPEYQQMRRDVEAGRVQAVVVWEVDRLTRKPRELEDWIDFADAKGLQLASVGGEIDLGTEQGRAMARMKGVFARLEAETTAKRLRAKHAEMAEAGRYVGRRPYGWQFATNANGQILTGRDQRLVIDEFEASVIRDCVRRTLAGESLWSIAKDLNERGIVTSTGAQWYTQVLRRTMLRPALAGLRKHQQYKAGRWVGKKQLHKAQWDAILDKDTHDRIVATLTDPKRVSNHGGTELKYLLTWLVLCGACGQRMVGANGKEYRIKGSYVRIDGTRSPDKIRVYPARYECPHAGCHGVTRRMDHVDEYVEAHILAWLEAEGMQVFDGDQVVVDEARVQIEVAKAKLVMLGDKWADDGLTDEQFDRQNARARSQLEDAQARLRAAQPADVLAEFCGEDAATAWLSADVAQKRVVLKALVERAGLQITVGRVGSGAFSAAGADPYAGIRVEWT